MILDDKTLDELEKEIPALCVEASRQAFREALASGSTVLVSESDGKGARFLYEVSPDGSRRVVKEMEPWTPVEMGLRLTIR